MRKSLSRKSINIRDKEDLIYFQLKKSRFYQQNLPAWRPVPTIGSIIIFYTLFSLIFISLGIILIVFSNQVKEFEVIYNEKCKNQTECEISYEIQEDMESPINIYYKLYGFFQNNRRYMKSKSLKQLLGEATTLSEMEKDEDCDPIYTNEDIGFLNDDKSADKESNLIINDVAIPCGIMAKTFFNDNFSIKEDNGKDITINENNIAWDKDKELFKNSDLSKQWINIEDEHFIVWMRPAGLPDFRKLWGRIENRDLKKGEKIKFVIQNNYDVDKFGGNKSIILSTSNKFGGDNTFLGVCFIVVGGISIFLGVGFFINYFIKKDDKETKKKK